MDRFHGAARSRGRRGTPATLAALIAVACALCSAAVPAHAVSADDTIFVEAAYSNSDAQASLLVTINASSQVESITAHIRAPGSDTDLLTVSDFTLTYGTDSVGTWEVSSPLPYGNGAGQLGFGTYDVYVDAADQGGTSVSDVLGGTITFSIEPTLSLSAEPMTIDYFHRQVTVSGTLTGTYPDGSTAPLGGYGITVSGDPGPVTTGPDGGFSVVEDSAQPTITASTEQAPDLDYANGTASVDLTVTTYQLEFAGKLAHAYVDPGSGDTLSGTLSYQSSGGKWLPMPDLPVSIYATYPQTGSASATTDGAGRFTVQLPGEPENISWTVSAGAWPFLSPLYSYVNEGVNQAATIERGRLSLDQFGYVSSAGCVVYKGQPDEYQTSAAPIMVEYAARPAGPWKLLGTMKAHWRGVTECPDNIVQDWYGHFAARLPSAYYREALADGDGVLAAHTGAVHLWRYLTKVSGVTVSARSVAKDGDLTVSGRLLARTSAWHPYGGRTVLIVLRPKGSKKWYWIKKVKTSASGSFSAVVRDPGSATWTAVYEGDKTHFASSGRAFYVSVSAAAAAAAGASVRLHLLPWNRTGL